jgi:hypothetical protein
VDSITGGWTPADTAIAVLLLTVGQTVVLSVYATRLYRTMRHLREQYVSQHEQATHFGTVIGLTGVLRLEAEKGGVLPINVTRAIYAAIDEAVADYRASGVPPKKTSAPALGALSARPSRDATADGDQLDHELTTLAASSPPIRDSA